VHDDGAAEAIAQPARSAGVIEMTMGDQEQLDRLGSNPCRFDVLKGRLVGVPAAGIDQGRVTLKGNEVDCRILRRRQLRPAHLNDLVRDAHRLACHDHLRLSILSGSAWAALSRLLARKTATV
jgi:hypothetical protein